MIVEFLADFSEDVEKINQKSIKSKIVRIIQQIESAKSLSQIPQVKKLSGRRNAYRVRIGNYRLGFFTEGNKVQFARIVHRKDIYRVFAKKE